MGGLLLVAILAALVIGGSARADTTWTLTITITGTGAGAVASADAQIDCHSDAPGVDCASTYADSTGVDLVPTPAAGSYFAGWSGGCLGALGLAGGEILVPMVADLACTAEFDDGGGTQSGSTLTVNTDSGASVGACYVNFCPLADALAAGSGKTVAFAGGVTTIHGSGFTANPASPMTVDGGTGVTIDAGGAGGVLLSQGGGTVTLKHLTLTNSHGGGIDESAGTLTLDHVTVDGNSKSGGVSDGAGVRSHGAITVTSSTISGNTAPMCAGIEMFGTGTVTKTLVTDNHASFAGGGLCVTGGTVVLTSGVISSNSSPQGGGAGVSGGTLTGGGTVFTNNAASTGAALLAGQGGVATLANETFTGNTTGTAVATYDASPGTIKLVNATIAGNAGGVGGVVTLLNTILANQPTGSDCTGGSPASLGHNIVDDGTCPFASAGDHANLDPKLDSPTADGFLPLLAGSPARDHGATGTVGGLAVPAKDALGTPRPQGSGIDIGAIEMLAHPATTPAITSFAPAAGRIRSTVTVNGSGFAGTTAVQFNGHDAASFKVVSDSRLTAVVPDDATSGAIKVTNAAGDATSGSFSITWPVPRLNAFTPPKAGAGATVTLVGTGFLGASAVAFNSIPATSFTVVSDTRITAVVPNDPSCAGSILVTTPGGGASRGSFVFLPAPTIGSFPADAALGVVITIDGSHFTGTKAVSFNGGAAKFKVVDDAHLQATVPSTATTGKIAVTNAGGTTLSGSDFTVDWATPVITSFTPASGPLLTKVTITGSHFTGATTVSFQGHASPTVKVLSDTKITAVVPTDAVTGSITVANPGASGFSASLFTLTWPVPRITSFTPTHGPVGTTVVITGTGLLGATAIAFNGTPVLGGTYLSTTKISVLVPAGATTGKITLTTPGGMATSALNFSVS